jgi:hypothetical protein
LYIPRIGPSSALDGPLTFPNLRFQSRQERQALSTQVLARKADLRGKNRNSRRDRNSFVNMRINRPPSDEFRSANPEPFPK